MPKSPTLTAVNHPVLSWLSSQLELSRGHARHWPAMEGMRGLAVGLVFLVHWVTLSTPWLTSDTGVFRVAQWVHAIGNVGVDIFFVLSGYLIYGSWIGRQQTFSTFLRRRVERIYPVFLVVLAIYLALSALFPSESKLPSGAWDWVLYVGANVLLLPGLWPIEPIITVAWSLSYEFFFYLTLPLLAELCGLRSRSPSWRLVWCLGMLAVAAFCLAWWGGPYRMLMFGAGMLLHEARTLYKVDALIPARAGGIALITGMLAALWPTTGTGEAVIHTLVMACMFAAACETCLHSRRTGWIKWLSWTPVRWLGNMSYSYYLLHGLALKAIYAAWGMFLPPSVCPPVWVVMAMPLVFLLTCVPSMALYAAVERPYSLRR